MNFFWKRRIPKLDPIEGYALWAPSYLHEDNPVKNYSDLFMEDALPPLSGLNVLDAGCGPGKFCRLAEDRGAEKITGVDLSERMIEQARQHCQRTNFICADLTHVTLDSGAYDIAICALVLGHCENLTNPLRVLAEALRAGGTLLITDFHPWQSRHHAKRTFTDPATKKVFEISHYVHDLDQYVSALNALSFTIDTVKEPAWKGNPLILGIKATKK